MISRTGVAVVADADIAAFFFTTPSGAIALLLGSAIIIAISALETACLMVIGLAATRQIRVPASAALLFAFRRAPAILRVASRIVFSILAVLAPFVLVIGAVYFGLLREHDINYYLAKKPGEFWLAVTLVGTSVTVLVVLLLRIVARWTLALPLLLFEEISPRRALQESAKRTAGNHGLVLLVLTTWLVLAIGLSTALTFLMEWTGRTIAPQMSGSLGTLLLFFSVLAFVWAVLGVAVAVFSASLFSLLIVQLYLRLGKPVGAGAVDAIGKTGESTFRASPARAGAIIIVGLLAAAGIGLLAFLGNRQNQPVLVIAHRGSSIAAPENTLAAFRLAATEGSDLVELDVQESADGIVVVNHDSDLMKAGGSPMKIWEHTAAELQTIDIGSHAGSQFHDQRVATLAEALAACKGSRILVELKSYGHNDQLEERVAKVVEDAGMVKECDYMSLDHDMVRKMKQIRPSWRVGALAAKTMGDITTLGADFVAVEARMATRRFVRRAHRAGQEVYVWTVDDPAWMLSAMSKGVDGLITNKPALAREVVARRARMSDAERILVAMLVRFGESPDSLEDENALRP
jgi:glycerophosphoryl diester phosphodiesterase